MKATTTNKMQIKEKIPFRSRLQIHITEIFLLLITLTSLFIIYYSYEKNSISVLDFSKTTIKRTNKIIDEKVSCLIQTSKQIPRLISNSINDLSEISINNINLVSYLKILASNYEDLSAFYIGSIDGTYISVINTVNQNQKNFVIESQSPLPQDTQYALHIVNKNPLPPFETFTYFDKDFKVVAKETPPQIGYDPRRRPWFSTQLKQDQVYWSNIYIDATLTKYLGNPIVIEKIQMDNVYLGLEFDSATSTKGNWTRIFSNLQQNTTTAPVKDKKKSKTPQASQPKNSDGGKTVIIKEVVINNISVDLVYLQGGGKIKKLPMIKQIVLKNINTQEGFPVDQLMNSVLGQMLTQVFIQQNLKNMIQSLIPDSSQLNELIQPFKGFLNP